MVREPGAQCRASARASASGGGGDEAGSPIQPPAASGVRGEPQWPVPTPKKGLGVTAGKTTARLGAMTSSLAPTKSVRKPALASSAEEPRSKVREAISFWEEHHNVQHVSSTFQQYDSHAPAKIEDCSDEGLIRNSEDILLLQLELDILKTIFVEERTAHAEVEDRTTGLAEELKAANLHILQACRQKEALGKELSYERSIVEALESHITLMNELDELKKNNFKSPVLLKKRDMEIPRLNSEHDIHHGKEYMPYEEPKTQNLKRIQASHEKERNLNTRYQQDQESHRSAEQEMVRRQVEIETAEVIISLQEELQQQIAEERKTYAEEKNEEIKLLERSIEDLEITVCSLENKVDIFKEEVEQQRRQREKLEVELQNVRLFLAVPSSGKAGGSLEDGIVDLADSTRHLCDVNNELLSAQESRRILRNEVSENESEISGPVQEGPTSSTIRHGRNMGMLPPFEELMRGSYASDVEPCADACSSADVSKEDVDISLPDAHALPHITSRRKQNTNPVAEAVEVAVEPTPLVEHPEGPGEELEESSFDEYMQKAEQLDVEMAQPLSDEDYRPESSQFGHPSASEQLNMSSASEQPNLYGNGTDSDQSLSESELEDEVGPQAVDPAVELLQENELPPVAPARLNDSVNYMRAPSDELKRLRSRNHYEGPRTATDRRFWSIEQQDLSIYRCAKVAHMKWIDWKHIHSIEQFAGVRERCADLGLEQIMSYCCDWDSELIRQFYSTVHISADKTSMTWMIDGRRITTNKRAWEERFGIPGGDHTEIHSQLFLDNDDKRILYTAAEYTLGHINGLSPLASIANKILKTTIYPRFGNTTHNWNVLYHIVKQQSFDIIALIFGEIDLLISDRSRAKDPLLYAPYIMGMIMRDFGYDRRRESRHHCYKPRPHYKPKLSKKVGPPASAAPAVAPPVAAPLPAFQPEVVAVGHEAHVEEVDDHRQFEAARHQPLVEAVQGQTMLVQPITHTDLFQVVEDRLRPIRDTLASMEGRIGRVQDGVAVPVQHINISSPSQITPPSTYLAPSLQATTTPTPSSLPSPEQASAVHIDHPGVSTQSVRARLSPFSRFPWYQRK